MLLFCHVLFFSAPLATLKRSWRLTDAPFAVMRPTLAPECLVGAWFCILTSFCGYLFAQGNPCLVAHKIICLGLKRPAAESLLFPDRILSTDFV